MMDLLTGMKTYVAAVETGSFTAAAQRMHLSPKLVSKYMTLLEGRLGARLMHRTTRKLSLTSAGQHYYAKCARLIEDLENLEAEVRDDTLGISGELRISAPTTFGELYILPMLQRFSSKHPDISFDLHLTDSFVDLAENGFDFALRIGQLNQANLIARKLTTTQICLVASPEYIASSGCPETVHDLKHHTCIRDSNLRSDNGWPFTVNGKAHRIKVGGTFTVNSALSVRNLAREAEGIALCPDYAVSKDIETGRLVRILPEFPSATLDIHAVFLEKRHIPIRVIACLDFMSHQFRTGILG